jgi:hypothetical protein
VSQLRLNQHSAGVLNGSFAISSASGYQRFCSNFLATSRESFTREILFTNEESPDYVYRQESSWPPTPGDPAERETGVVVALDVKTGQHHPIFGMGRHNHENDVAIPGYHEPVVFSGDDTFTSGPLTDPSNTTAKLAPSQSQLYSYIAPSTDSLLADQGDLWAFVSDTRRQELHDVIPGSGTVVTGHFIKVPKDIATGLNPDGSELKAADKVPLPPTDGSWQTDFAPRRPSASTVRSGSSNTGATSTTCSSSSHEDIAYDKRRAWATSSTSSTPVEAGASTRVWTRRTSSPRTAASGGWSSTRTIRRR